MHMIHNATLKTFIWSENYPNVFLENDHFQKLNHEYLHTWKWSTFEGTLGMHVHSPFKSKNVRYCDEQFIKAEMAEAINMTPSEFDVVAGQLLQVKHYKKIF